MTNAHILYSEFGQSIWLNYFDRNLLVNGGFDGLILDGIRGANNNAEIFFNVFTSSNGYDETIRDFVEDDASIDGKPYINGLSPKILAWQLISSEPSMTAAKVTMGL